MLFWSTASCSCKGKPGLFLSAWVGSSCILGMPSTEPTAHTELLGWDGSLVSTQGHVPLVWVLQKPWSSKLCSRLLLGSADRFWLNWAENQSVWVIASLCWVAGCCKTTQRFRLFSCSLECVSGSAVESFLPGVSGSRLLTFRWVPVHPGECMEMGCCNAGGEIARFLKES